MTVIAVVFWLILSFVVSNAAKERGRDKINWFALSIVASPVLAALFLLLFPPVVRQVVPYSTKDSALGQAINATEPDNREGSRVTIAIFAVVFTILGVVGVLVVERANQFDAVSSSRQQSTTSQMSISQARPYETLVQMTCVDLLNALDTSQSSELIILLIERDTYKVVTA
jgi:preprotein translocase subunit SecG